LTFALLLQPALAQVDAAVLERLQKSLGGQSVDPAEALDNSRSRGQSPATTSERAGSTAEELELRRQQSKIELDALYRPSPVERDFRERLADNSLRQFGYDLFRSGLATSGPVTGEVGDGYILGPGDELVVTFQGATNQSQTARVARDGRLIVGTLPPIPAAGRSLGAVKTSISTATRENLLGTDVYVSMGGVRAATVFVGGEVERPGQYQLTSMADIASALALAGGIRKSGSLRSVRLVRGGVTRTVDLYGLLGIGMPPATAIRDGDRIIVPVIGDTIAIAGAVARPGIYELRGSGKIADVVGYAGGALRPRGYEVSISRIANDGRETFVRSAGNNAVAIAGDAIQIIGGGAGAPQNRVTLIGYVLNRGPRSLTSAPTVADLVGRTSDLRLGTYLPMAVIIRRDQLTGMRRLEGFDLRQALDGTRVMPLQNDDRVYVFSESDIAFLNSAAVRQTLLGEAPPASGCRTLDRLAALVANTQSPRFNVVTRGVLTEERQGREFVASAARSLSSNVAGAETANGIDSGDAKRLLDSTSPPAVQQYETCPQVFEDAFDLLPFLIENSVGVGGAVRRPGAYPVTPATSAATVVAAADGLLANAHSRDMFADIIRADTATSEQLLISTSEPSALSSIALSPGDDIRLNQTTPNYEAGAVLLSGEFVSPGLYAIRPGERLSELFKRAGGLSATAYPFGAVFTRRSVREQQEDGFKRTARELNTSLLALAARENVNGEAVAAAGQLIQSLSTAEAVGRMVVEADPRVLEQRPDLDPVLEAGDRIYMPKRPTYVLALGDVSNPGALQFVPGKPASAYLNEAGGTQSTADDGRAFLVLPNGSAQPLKQGFWRRANAIVPPGSTIIVPKNLDPLRSLGIIRDVATIFGQLATAVASVAILADRNN
jgi:protein involved in polysaccharide export with SLBB domain